VKLYGNKPIDLRLHQRKLLGLIKHTYEGSDDEDLYIRTVASSAELDLIREIVTWWRVFAIERYCILTPTLLKRLGIFDHIVQEFARTRRTSHLPRTPEFIEQLGIEFLIEMGRHENELISSVAQFELALIRVKHGDAGEHIVDWHHNPNNVLHSLVHGVPLGEAIDYSPYRTIVCSKEPKLFRVLRLSSLRS
jgi:hypothetical protein